MNNDRHYSYYAYHPPQTAVSNNTSHTPIIHEWEDTHAYVI